MNSCARSSRLRTNSRSRYASVNSTSRMASRQSQTSLVPLPRLSTTGTRRWVPAVSIWCSWRRTRHCLRLASSPRSSTMTIVLLPSIDFTLRIPCVNGRQSATRRLSDLLRPLPPGCWSDRRGSGGLCQPIAYRYPCYRQRECDHVIILRAAIWAMACFNQRIQRLIYIPRHFKDVDVLVLCVGYSTVSTFNLALNDIMLKDVWNVNVVQQRNMKMLMMLLLCRPRTFVIAHGGGGIVMLEDNLYFSLVEVVYADDLSVHGVV